MPAAQLPRRPPPRALHLIACPPGALLTGVAWTVLCAARSRRLHGTLTRALVTCPRCLAVLADPPPGPRPSGGPDGPHDVSGAPPGLSRSRPTP